MIRKDNSIPYKVKCKVLEVKHNLKMEKLRKTYQSPNYFKNSFSNLHNVRTLLHFKNGKQY